jgi:hypothetical protein
MRAVRPAASADAVHMKLAMHLTSGLFGAIDRSVDLLRLRRVDFDRPMADKDRNRTLHPSAKVVFT